MRLTDYVATSHGGYLAGYRLIWNEVRNIAVYGEN
jgi:hypothetical protein